MNNAKIITLLEQLLKEFSPEEPPKAQNKTPTAQPDSDLTHFWQEYQLYSAAALDALRTFIQRLQHKQATRATVIASMQEADGYPESEAQVTYSRMKRLLCDVSLDLNNLKLTPHYQDIRQAKVKRS